jgi:hypothetical protein
VDGQHVSEVHNPLVILAKLGLKKDIRFNQETGEQPNNFKEIFFEHFFPSVKEHCKLMDEYLLDVRASYYTTVKDNKITFRDPDNDGPDWIVRQCYFTMIVSIMEADVDVKKLWKTGKSGRRCFNAKFGQYVPKNTFKAFHSCAAFMFCDKKYQSSTK